MHQDKGKENSGATAGECLFKSKTNDFVCGSEFHNKPAYFPRTNHKEHSHRKNRTCRNTSCIPSLMLQGSRHPPSPTLQALAWKIMPMIEGLLTKPCFLLLGLLMLLTSEAMVATVTAC